MSSTDDRIVRMRFENEQFKRGAADTQKSLADMNRAIDQTGKGKGLLDLNTGMGKIGVTASKMAVMTTTALATIANKITNVGINMAKSLTLDPLKQGFAEYESMLTKQNVIMNATGKSAAVVKATLNDLNRYSDKTIYSFGDMTDSITKFVNAGVSLPQSVQTIKGIGNAAAFAGASSGEASRSMYAFAQMMSMGFIGLQDWRQVENANMGTVKFKQTLIDSAVAMGQLTKKGNEYVTKSGKAFTATTGWNNALQEQWATTEVLNDSLSKYSDKNTELGKKAFAAAQQVRTFSAFMDTLKESIGSGWSQVFTSIFGNLNQATSMWTGLSNAVGGAVGKFFSFVSAALQGWRALGGFEKVMGGFKNILAPIVALFKAVGAAWQAAFPSKEGSAGGTLYKISDGFEKLTRPLAKLAELIPRMVPFLTKFFEILGKGAGAIPVVIGYISDLVKSLTDAFSFKLPSGGGAVDQFAKNIMSGLKKVYEAGKQIAKTIFGGIAAGFTNGSINTTASILGAGLLGALVMQIKKIIKNGLSLDLTGGLFDTIKNTFGQLTSTLKTMQQEVKAKMIMEIAIAVALLAASIIALSFVDPKRIISSMAGLATGLGMLLGSMVILDKIAKTTGFLKLPMIAASMILLAGSLLILAAAIAVMGMLSWEQIAKGLTGIAGALIIIAGAMQIMPKNMPLMAIGLALVGGALLAIAGALAIMGHLSLGEIGSSLGTTAAALILIGLAMRTMPAALPITAAGLALVGFALGEIAAALKLMGTMSFEEIARGLTALGGSLAILAVGLNAMNGTIAGSAALLIAAAAIAVLVPPLILMSKLSWEEIAKGMVGLAGGLAILALGMAGMVEALPGALALLVIAPALMLLALALQVLGKMSWSELGVALVALAAGLTVIGLAGLLLAPVIPALIGLGAALLLLGGGLALAGVGIYLFAKGLSMLVGLATSAFGKIKDVVMNFVSLMPILGAGFGTLIVSFAKSIAKNAPALISSFMTVLGQLIDKAKTLLPKLGSLMNQAIKTMLNVVRTNVPNIVSAGIDLILGLLRGLKSRIGQIASTAISIIISFAKSLQSGVSRLATAGIALIAKFLHSLADAIRGGSGAIGGGISDVASAMQTVGVEMIQGLIAGVTSMVSAAIGSVADIASGMVAAAKNVVKSKSPSKVFMAIGKFIVQGLTLGVQNNAAAAVNAVAAMVSDQVAIANEYLSRYIMNLDQRALAARAKAEGLADAAKRAADAAQKQTDAASKTKKDKKDDVKAKKATTAAKVLDRTAKRADSAAKAKEATARRAKARQDRDKAYAEADTIGKAKMRSAEAQTAAENALAQERTAEAKRTAAALLANQAKNKNIDAATRKSFLAQAAKLRREATAAANASNAWLANARTGARDAMALQAQAGKEAADAFDKQYAAEAEADAKSEAFDKMTLAEKAAERRRQATELQIQADKDLAAAKKMAYTDLEEANRLAELAMGEAETAREYVKDAADYDKQEADRVAQGGVETPNGVVVDLAPSEAAGFEFNKYNDLYGSGLAAAAASGPSVEFYQYNTSPESLSPTEVYRQTHNLITYAAGRVAA